MPSAGSWTPEGPDTARIAAAINAGEIDRTTTSYEAYFSGPGADLADKYKKHTPNGKRNLRRNFLALYDKIILWNTNKPNPKTGSSKLSLSTQIVYF